MISIQGPGLKQRGIAPLISCGHQWPLHINGDQHLTTLCQYGTKQQRDSNCSFCTLAISAGYPRWWLSDEVGKPPQNRPAHGHTNTGEYLDGFGNKVYVDAVGNPVVGKAPNRYDKAHEKGSGFGFMTCDTVKKRYALASFRFLVDATDGKASNQFPGFPVTIHQEENPGENRFRQTYRISALAMMSPEAGDATSNSLAVSNLRKR